MSLTKGQILRGLYSGVAVLLVAHLAAYTIKVTTGHDRLLGLIPLVDFYAEGNLPTWFSTMLLMASAVLLLAVFCANRNATNRYYWLALSILFVFLSVDEFAQLHELIGSYISTTRAQQLLPSETSSAWVFWGAIMVLAVALIYFRFWRLLTPRIRRAFLLAGIVYVGGALGVEIIEIFYLARFGSNAGYFVLVTIEELMEMLGIVLFVGGLLDQLILDKAVLELRLQ